MQTLEDELSATAHDLRLAFRGGFSRLDKEQLEPLDNVANDIMYPRIDRLSTVPGGLEIAIRFLLRQKTEERPYWSTSEENAAAEAKCDDRLRGMIERHIAVSSKQGIKWCASRCIELVLHVCFTLEQTTLSILGRWACRSPGPEKRWHADGKVRRRFWIQYFPGTFRFLFARHSREVGHSLALKVCGHVLPPEMTELIADSCCDSLVTIEKLAPTSFQTLLSSRGCDLFFPTT